MLCDTGPLNTCLLSGFRFAFAVVQKKYLFGRRVTFSSQFGLEEYGGPRVRLGFDVSFLKQEKS